MFDRELASDKKFFELDAKSKSEASDSEGRGKKVYRDYFGIGGQDLDNNDTTRDLLAEEGVGSGSDREETKNDRGRAAVNFKRDSTAAPTATPASDSSGRISGRRNQGNRALAVSARP